MVPCIHRLRPVKEMAQSHEYLSIEYSEEEVWLTWTDKNNEHHEKSVRQLAQEARAGNAHDENVLSYYRCPGPPAGLGQALPWDEPQRLLRVLLPPLSPARPSQRDWAARGALVGLRTGSAQWPERDPHPFPNIHILKIRTLGNTHQMLTLSPALVKTLHPITQFSLTTTLRGRACHYPHCKVGTGVHAC